MTPYFFFYYERRPRRWRGMLGRLALKLLMRVKYFPYTSVMYVTK